MLMKYRRKPNSGKMHMQSRKGGHKQRKASLVTLYPGDEMTVSRIEELPGYPHAMDGWELVGHIEEEKQTPKDDRMGVGPVPLVAELESKRSGRGWVVVIKTPGANQEHDGVVLSTGTKVHSGILNEEVAKRWAETGVDPRGAANA